MESKLFSYLPGCRKDVNDEGIMPETKGIRPTKHQLLGYENHTLI